MKKENQAESEIPSYQEFCEWKMCQLCNEKNLFLYQKYKNMTYEEYCIIYKKKQLKSNGNQENINKNNNRWI